MPFSRRNKNDKKLYRMAGLKIFPNSIFLLLIFKLIIPIHTLEITEKGVRSVHHDDTAMVFYANVMNNGSESNSPIAARLKMHECCFADSNTTCHEMQLISGLGAVVHPQDEAVLQMYYVNHDLVDREGSCTLQLMTSQMPQTTSKAGLKSALNHGGWQPGEEIIIPFKTGLATSLVRKIMSTIGMSKQDKITCNTNTREAKQECANYECQLRYSGVRSFHNSSSGKCEPTVDCGDGAILSPSTGECETVQDVQHIKLSFARELILPKRTFPLENDTSNLRVTQNVTEEDEATTEYERKKGILLLCFLIIAILTPIIALSFYIWRERRAWTKKQERHNNQDDDEGGGEPATEDEEDADTIIAEIANRREPSVKKSESAKVADSKSTTSNSKSTTSNSKSTISKDPTKSEIKVPVTESRSTDELLQMDKVEKYGAHVPINPVPSKTSIPLSSKRSGNNNQVTLKAPSSEEITEHKKELWAQYVQSVSDERMGDVRNGNYDSQEQGSRSFTDFNYFNKDRQVPIHLETNVASPMKVQSLPKMIYTPPTLPKTNDENGNLEKAKAYSILSSLSNANLPNGNQKSSHSSLKKPSIIRSNQSIWSNVASENAAEPEPEIASNSSSYSDVRTRSIYGGLASDEDTDGALEEIATGMKTKQKSNAKRFEMNQKLYGFPQKLSTISDSMTVESDLVPSEAYNTTDTSNMTSPVASISEFWTQLGDGGSKQRGNRNDESLWLHRYSGGDQRAKESGSDFDMLSPETKSAYRIKSSLQKELKAKRSRSDTNFFI